MQYCKNNKITQIILGSTLIASSSLFIYQVYKRIQQQGRLNIQQSQNLQAKSQDEQTLKDIELEVKKAKFITMFQELKRRNRLELLELLENEGQSIRQRFGMSPNQAKTQVLGQENVNYLRSKIQEEVFKEHGFTQQDINELINNQFAQDLEVLTIVNQVLDQIELSASGEIVPLITEIPDNFKNEDWVYNIIKKTLLKQAIFLRNQILQLLATGNSEYMQNPQQISEMGKNIQKIKQDMLSENGLTGLEDSPGRIYKQAIKQLSPEFQKKFVQIAHKYQEISQQILMNPTDISLEDEQLEKQFNL